ncbi:LacI family DNA-binding transcriptional regulator [Humibacillus xanthopallidus]|uniref:LacI family transcriptional regulator n=1 Tax=Humibacillus xanthopallidus TaxID=412689 RepID=A0A543HZK6_9MICO|nr:LacI family DNA-binding transcriptional regulator [Humibacillus xanthopallidus]TQM63762.1 LacI family transcriptional regulator [Humibacillus xanthopallidus]
MTEQLTLADVAARAGVSRATASLVLRGTGRVSSKTRDRVLATMREMGYVYNRGAATLRTQRTSVVGVVVTHIANPYFGEVLGGLDAELKRAGFATLLADTGDDVDEQRRALQTMREQRVDGLALIPATGTPAALLDEFAEWSLPHVLVSRYLDDGNSSYVGADDVLGGRLAAEHLLEHGCRTIHYLGGIEGILSRRDRIRGVGAAMAEAGLPASALTRSVWEVSGQGGLAGGRALLDGESLPDGVICHSDSIAMGLYRALYDAGAADVLRVIGYDDVAAAALWEPPLTSIATHGGSLGAAAGRLLVERIGQPRGQVVVQRAAPELVVRRSCGCHS